MPGMLRLDCRFKPGAYVRRRDRVFEVLRYERTSAQTSELRVEDICSFERLAFNTLETRRLVLIRAAPDPAPIQDHKPAMDPDPQYVALCQEAEAKGMQVAIGVGAVCGRKGSEYRPLTAITLVPAGGHGRDGVTVAIRFGEHITVAAAKARVELERHRA